MKEELATKAVGLTKKYTKQVFVYPTQPDVIKSRWSVHDGGSIWMHGPQVANRLPAGVYIANTSMQGPYLERVEFSTDKLVPLSDDPSSEVMDHIEEFWTKRDDFEKFGFIFKRGILLYGPPGGGKSSTIFQLANRFVNQDGIVMLVDYPSDCEACLRMLKSLEPDRQVVVIMEDIDTIIAHYGDRKLTHLLDGGADVQGVVFVATTNYPLRLPPRLLNRPSRFDLVIYIGMPSETARREYISAVLEGNLLVDIDAMVAATEGLGIASIKEVILLTQVFGLSISDAVDKVKNLGKNLIVD